MKSIPDDAGFAESGSEQGPSAQPAAIPACADPWMQAMRSGHFEEAWTISDAVLRQRTGVPCFHLPRHEQYLWNGDSLQGKRVLVRCYHGLGDTIQFIRFVARLKEIAREVMVWAQPALIPLLRTASGVDHALVLHDGVPEVDYDADVEIMELAHVFRTTLATLPRRVPYLHVPGDDVPIPTEAATAKKRLRPRVGHTGMREARRNSPAVVGGATLKVGLVWQSGGWDERRSIGTELLEPLARVPGVHLVALQKGAALAGWKPEWGTIGSTDDVAELAGRIQGLDLVLSVDSFPAHLAGALAVPTWTLLHSDPDWRWMLERDDSPWYPTMRLWRQERAGEWEPVIARIAQELGAYPALQHPERA